MMNKFVVLAVFSFFCSASIGTAVAGISCHEIGLAYGQKMQSLCIKQQKKNARIRAIGEVENPFQGTVNCKERVLAGEYKSVKACIRSQEIFKAKQKVLESAENVF